MNYDFEIRELRPEPILGIRATTTPDEIGATLAKILPRVHSFAQKRGYEMASPPLSIYHAYNEERVEIEGGVTLLRKGSGEGEIRAGMLPGGRAAVTVHVGPYEGLKEAYQELEAWIQLQGKEASGPPWEIYWTDPGEEPDSSKWKTEIYWPLK